jgi:hypothetical protein
MTLQYTLRWQNSVKEEGENERYVNREIVACCILHTQKKDLRMGDTSVASTFLNFLGYFLNIVACRPVATQRPRNKQLETAIIGQQAVNSNRGNVFSLRPLQIYCKQDS